MAHSRLALRAGMRTSVFSTNWLTHLRGWLGPVAAWTVFCALLAPAFAAEPPQTPAPLGAAEATVLRGATLWTGTGAVLLDTDLLMVRGKIAAVGKNLSVPGKTREIDARGRIATPGLVDMHSHLGLYAVPNSRAHGDGNEMTAPTTPMVRAIDGFDPEDAAIARAVSGGVTTALVLPGSGNIMGGQGLFIKLFGQSTADMELPGAPRALKWAMGENPKRYYGSRGQMPMSRMGHAWLIRQKLQEAKDLKDLQDKWDREPQGMRPQRQDLEALVGLLRREVQLHVHCYERHDIETLLRLASEFHIQVTAIHHALEAWKVPDLLRDRRVSVALFSDLWGFKHEAYDASVHAPRLLLQAGVNVALKSDHPVIDARDLMGEAAKSHHYGVAEQQALQLVTRNPAIALGLIDRLGTLELGKDADVVLWPGNPLQLGARPQRVFVNGIQVVGDGDNLQARWSGDAHPTGNVCGCGP